MVTCFRAFYLRTGNSDERFSKMNFNLLITKKRKYEIKMEGSAGSFQAPLVQFSHIPSGKIPYSKDPFALQRSADKGGHCRHRPGIIGLLNALLANAGSVM